MCTRGHLVHLAGGRTVLGIALTITRYFPRAIPSTDPIDLGHLTTHLSQSLHRHEYAKSLWSLSHGGGRMSLMIGVVKACQVVGRVDVAPAPA